MFKFFFYNILTLLIILTSLDSAKPQTLSVTAKIAIEGLLTNNSRHIISDSVTIYLSKSAEPEIKIDSSKALINYISLSGIFNFSLQNKTNGNYYLIIKHRNSLMTWSQPVYLNFEISGIFNYDFTNKITQAYGSNLIFKYGRYCIFSGDINQDGTIDGDDGTAIENDALVSLSGYLKTDLNGDNFIDGSDLSTVDYSLMINKEIKIPYLKLPLRDAIPVKADINRDVLILPYTSVIYKNGVFSMYYRTNNLVKLDTSIDGKTWKFKKNISVNVNGTPNAGDSLQSTIRRGNTWYSGWTNHSGSGSSFREWFNTATSTNGYNFTQNPGNPYSFNPGEDQTLFDNADSFYCYIRPNIPSIDPRRKIGLMKSANFLNWTRIDTVIEFPDSAYFNPASRLYFKQPYNMNVFRNGADWWGFMHVLRIEDDGTENWNFPYSGIEETVETHLMYSTNGVDWSYTNNKKAFVPIHDSVNQVYALPTIVNDSLYIYSFESTLRHAGYSLEDQGQAAFDYAKGKYWKIFKYKISLEDLNVWKP